MSIYVSNRKSYEKINLNRHRSYLNKLITSVKGIKLIENKNKAGQSVYYEGKLVARNFRKKELYNFLSEFGVNWCDVLSKQIFPTDALQIIDNKTLLIIEVRCKQAVKYVYRKLQACNFKRKQFIKLVAPLGIKVEYVFVLDDRFRKQEYKDILEYVGRVL